MANNFQRVAAAPICGSQSLCPPAIPSRCRPTPPATRQFSTRRCTDWTIGDSTGSRSKGLHNGPNGLACWIGFIAQVIDNKQVNLNNVDLGTIKTANPGVFMTTHSNFWPLDFDQEVEIYDSPSWNLPGRRKKQRRKESEP